MSYRHILNKYEKIGNKWKLIETNDFGIINEKQYRELTSKSTKKYFSNVFGSKEIIEKLSNGAKVTSQLNDIKLVHIATKV